MNVFDKLTLPNGSVIPNRIAKAAMEENMADASQGPSEKLMRLYEAWANGGAGLLITGNVMVDSRAMTGPGGVVLEDDRNWRSSRAGRRSADPKAHSSGCRSIIRVVRCKPILASRHGRLLRYRSTWASCPNVSIRRSP